MMLRNRATRVLVLFLVVGVFNTPWMSAQGRSSSRVESHAAVGLWGWLARTLQKEGCSLDPDGKFCRHNSLQAPDAGCSLDPDGCFPLNFNLDAGCSLDPRAQSIVPPGEFQRNQEVFAVLGLSYPPDPLPVEDDDILRLKRRRS